VPQKIEKSMIYYEHTDDNDKYFQVDIKTMDVNETIYNVIRNHYFGHILASSIDRDDLIVPSGPLKKIIKYVDDFNNSQYSALHKVVSSAVFYENVDQIMRVANGKTSFDRLIYIFSIGKVLVDYLKENPDDIDKVNRIVDEISKKLTEGHFVDSLFSDHRYQECIKYGNTDIVKNSSTIWKPILLTIGTAGIAGLYLFLKGKK